MLRKIRTYRSVYRMLAMSLFVTSVLSLIGHACMMDEAHAGPRVKKCCCEKAHSGHEDMEDMAGRLCDETQETQHTENFHGDCCSEDFQTASYDAATRINKASPEEIIASALLFASVQDVFEAAHWNTEKRLQNTGPPLSPPLSLHILLARFLN